MSTCICKLVRPGPAVGLSSLGDAGARHGYDLNVCTCVIKTVLVASLNNAILGRRQTRTLGVRDGAAAAAVGPSVVAFDRHLDTM